MSQDSIVVEAQDLLLDLGIETFLLSAFPDAARTLAMKCPVFSEIQMVSTFWAAGQLTASGQTMVFTDDSTDAQSSAPSDFLLCSTLANDGHMIGAYGMFEKVVYTLGVADDGTGVYDFAYWDGRFWAALALLSTPNFHAVGTQTMAFVPPEDWQQGVPTDITFPVADGFDANLFWVRVRATTGPAVALSATQIRVDTAIYPLPDTVLSLLSVLYYPNELEPVPVAEGLDLLQPGWRTATGTPTRYTQDLGPLQRVRIAPIPTAVGTLGLPIFTGAFGATVGPNNLIVATLQVPEEPDFPEWFQCLVSYTIAAREARRLGESSDLALGAALEGLVDGLVGMMSGLWREDGQELSRPYTSPLRRNT